MLWDCPRCGQRGLLGLDHRHCPACGTPQDPAARYFPEPGREVEAKGHVWSGVDRTCQYCATPNSANASFCVNCGAPLDGAVEVALKSDTPTRIPDDPPEAPKKPFWERSINPNLAILFGILVFLGVFAYGTLAKDDHVVVVRGLSWERRVSLERYGPMSSGSWCSSVPGDAKVVDRQRKQSGSRQVADGETCRDERVDQGDGTFRIETTCETTYRSEPEYDDWCDWTATRWLPDGERVAKGGLDSTPAWPDVQASGTGIGAIRTAGRDELWTVSLAEAKGNRSWECRFRPGQQERYTMASRWVLPVRRNGEASCSDLKPAQ